MQSRNDPLTLSKPASLTDDLRLDTAGESVVLTLPPDNTLDTAS